MPRSRKHRSDSIIGNLAPTVRDEVDRMLLANESGKAVRDYLATQNVKISEQSISDYRRIHLAKYQTDRLARIAAEVNSIPTDGLADALRTRVLQAALEIALSDMTDPAVIARLGKLIDSAERVDIMRRKLQLAERKAADADRAREALASSSLSLEEKTARIREIFGIS